MPCGLPPMLTPCHLHCLSVCRMSYEDFVGNYSKVEICNMGPDSPQDDTKVKKRWEATVNEGEWKAKVNAGGCRNFLGEYGVTTEGVLRRGEGVGREY